MNDPSIAPIMAPARGLSVLGWDRLDGLGAGRRVGEPATPTSTSTRSALVAENALTANALTANALTANALTANALTANALTANALTANALTANGLRDPLGRELLKYVVSCALPDGDSVTVKVDGTTLRRSRARSGLAPDWGRAHGSCDGSCQRWVSACVLARVDAAGVERDDLDPRRQPARCARAGTSCATTRTARRPTTATSSPTASRATSACRRAATSDQRVCGPSLADCPMTVVGSCDDVCADRGAFGTFQDCRDRAVAGAAATSIAESVTVFLPRSAM